MRSRHVAGFAGVIGWPLEHTLSPAIHNASFRSLGIDWIYLAWPVPPESLGAAIDGLRVLGAMEVNVLARRQHAAMSDQAAIAGATEEWILRGPLSKRLMVRIPSGRVQPHNQQTCDSALVGQSQT